MSNYQGRKSEYTPAVYTRYFEQTENPKSSNGHIFFDEDNEEKSSNYQAKRDLLFKRLFPSKYAQSNNDQSELDKNQPNKPNTSSNNTAQSLGDFIPLSETKKQSSPNADVTFSSSDETDDDLLIETELPTVAHESIVGHLHPRSTIENVRAILIREFYQRTSDSHTEWLKCKMELPREYINPKYYADFQRRYRRDIEKFGTQKKKSSSTKNKTDHGYSASSSTKTNIKMENEDIVETSYIEPLKGNSSSSPIVISNSVSTESSSPPEYVVLDSDEDDDNLNSDANSSYFIDRSSTSFTAISQPTIDTSTDDYNKEDSKYAQLPSRTTSASPTVLRPIISKHQRRKQNQEKSPSKPLVSAIDRIIDHMDQMDQSKTLNDSNTMEEQNLLIKQIKKRKKKKKKKSLVTN